MNTTASAIVALDLDVVRPLLAEDPDATLRKVLALALEATCDPDLTGSINGSVEDWQNVAEFLAEKVDQPGPVCLDALELDVATDALDSLARHWHEFADDEIERFGPYAGQLCRDLMKLHEHGLLREMRSLDCDLPALAAYSAILLGGDWQTGEEDGFTVLRLADEYTVIFEPLPVGASNTPLLDFDYGGPEHLALFNLSELGVTRSPVTLIGFGDGQDDEQDESVNPDDDHGLHRIATEVAEAVLRMRAQTTQYTK